MPIEFSDYFPRLERILSQATSLCSEQHPGADASWEAILDRAALQLESDGTLRVALIGEFNAGKSSIISALTGEDLFIDADVATSTVAEYPWRGVVLVDTPGLHAEDSETDHDQIARQATIGADLVLFVVTNELFSPRLARHLQFVIGRNGLALAGKTAVVVNKIDRETNADEVIVSEVVKVLTEYEDVPIWLCAASKHLDAHAASEDLRQRFRRQSRVRELVHSIDAFVRDAGCTGRLVTPLQLVADVLDQAQAAVADHEEARNQLEVIRRQRRILNSLSFRLAEIRRTWKQKAYSTVMGQAEGAVAQVGETTTGDDLQDLLEVGLRSADADQDAVRDGARAAIVEAFNEAADDLAELGKSPLVQDVMSIEAQREGPVSVDVGKHRPADNSFLAKIGRSTFPHLEKALKDAAKDTGGMRDVYYRVGKKLFARKFRPWEAVKGGEKLAKAAGRAGKALPFLTFALETYINSREQKAKEEKERYLAKLRIALRKAFADQAGVEAQCLDRAVAEVANGPVSNAIEQLEDNAERLTGEDTTRRQLASDIASLKRDCLYLQRQLLGESG